MDITDTRTYAAREALTKLLTGHAPELHDGLLRRDDAYTVLLGLLSHIETSGRRRTSVGELYTWSRVTPGGQVLGGHDHLMTLLERAADHGLVRLDRGEVHIGDAPTGGGPGHVWMRQLTQGGAQVELIGAEPWPLGTYVHDETRAWWHCTGCREGLAESTAMYVHAVRQQVTDHAAECPYLPPLPDAS
ncbi:hypothetical protein [Streptomyces sp. NRRL WC-3742]|uniref:hypothetical protein n=1 Tax=Streptomyces sp. NRRL WC-3742 TaxID=1463934 RepID=UPI0004C7B426|nr:hypothetical protein [Streptomyces sp. NRRL WC-3742]